MYFSIINYLSTFSLQMCYSIRLLTVNIVRKRKRERKSVWKIKKKETLSERRQLCAGIQAWLLPVFWGANPSEVDIQQCQLWVIGSFLNKETNKTKLETVGNMFFRSIKKGVSRTLNNRQKMTVNKWHKFMFRRCYQCIKPDGLT